MNAIHFRSLLVATCATLMCGCAGTKVLKEPVPQPERPPVASACDAQLCADVDWVIVRDGPGTWAAKANWDEYLLAIWNRSAASLQITGISIYDVAGHRLEPATNRAALVKGSKEAVRRYKDSDVTVEAGMGAGTLVATGGAVAAAGVGAAYAAAVASPLGAGGGVALGLGVAAIGPILIVNGVVRGINNGKVNDEIQRRQSVMPQEVAAQATGALDVFIPLAPAPSRVEISYVIEGTARTLSVDTSAALAGLHLPPASAQLGSN